ncbi:MAG: ISKra4 family transposase [Acidobacteriia bacterium]|nr:ISKra4 family transposase [Terriglobia bacterium]
MVTIARARQADLESWETGLRAAVLAAGAKALAALLEGIGAGRRECPVVCACGLHMESRGLREKLLMTILGMVPYRRSMYQCPGCGKTCFPGDEELDVAGTTRSPGLRRMMARAGSQSTFKEGREDLRVYAGIEVSAKDVERVAENIGQEMETWSNEEQKEVLAQEPSSGAKTIPIMYVCYDGTGVPMTRTELAGRKGKQPDGSALTREVKLGCVFTQTTTDENGFAVRDPESTSFVGAIESSDKFGWRIYAEAVRRGLYSAKQTVILGDAAEWIHSIKEEHFHDAIQIVDLYHAREHVASLCKHLFAADERTVVRHRLRWWTLLDEGKIEKILQQAGQKLPLNSEAREKAESKIAFLDKHKEMMRYADFRKRGFFVGSGVMEAGCKTVIGLRMKQSGMEWSLRGANAIISLRCVMKSSRLEDYWESRAR